MPNQTPRVYNLKETRFQINSNFKLILYIRHVVLAIYKMTVKQIHNLANVLQ